MDLDYCANFYGIAPCNAAIGVTGQQQCLNVLSKDPTSSCQDRANYIKTVKTWKFCTATVRPPYDYWPFVTDIKLNPTEITPGRGISKRGSVTFTLKSQSFKSSFYDKYFDQRSESAEEVGDFLAKFWAMNTYYQNRVVRVYEGFNNVPFSVNDFIVREYRIESITPPDANGNMKIVAKDILKIASNKKSQVPELTTGQLTVAIPDAGAVTTISLDNATEYTDPAISGQTEHVQIGDEMFSYTGISGNNLTGVTRAQNNSEEESADIGDTVQVCKTFVQVPFADALQDVLVNYGGVDPSHIPKADWDAEMAQWLPDLILDAIIVEPTGVMDIADEWMQMFPVYIWPDEIDVEIKLSAIKPALETVYPTITSDSGIIEGSFSMQERVEDRISFYSFYYDIKNPADDFSTKKNYLRADSVIDVAAESSEEYGERRIKRRHCRWLKSGATALVKQMTSREVNRFRDNPLFFYFEIDPKDFDARTGDIALISSNQIQNGLGYSDPFYARILKTNVQKNGYIKYKAEDVRFNNRYFLLSTLDGVTYSNAGSFRERYGWLGNEALINQGFSNGDNPYVLL